VSKNKKNALVSNEKLLDLHVKNHLKDKSPKEIKFVGWGLEVPNQILYAMNKEGLK
jgi:hypothetical protein